LNKAPDAFRTISEVADELDLPQHVLRFWESRFAHIKPLKRGGGRRYYRPEDIDLLRGIRRLLYADGYTIRGVQRILREQGVRTVQLVGQGHDVPMLLRDGGEDERNGNGGLANGGLANVGLAEVNFLASPHPEDDAEDDGGGSLEAVAPARPQNGPITEASIVQVRPAAAAPVPRREAGPVGQTRGAVAPPIVVTAVAATPIAATPVAVAPVTVPPVSAPAVTAPPVKSPPVSAAMPSPPNMAARDLDRLKQALAELEACRRLLDKAIEGGR
jgi:DNA-binding transcriptional MerR regulator